MTATAELKDPLIGTRIDNRYVVHGVLGRGGMGVVYDGVHEQLGREVAIKVLGASIANDPTAIQRFLREARTASQLTHGNIVDVSDLGALPDGRPYLVMAKLHGVDLWSLVQQQGPQTPRRVAQLLQGAAAALDLIHAKGFVHRDVKPENLMHVVREDGSEAVLLLDFGIVGLMTPDTTRLTAAGVLFGTPAYLAPEVIRGGKPDARADIYALATVAFEMITGRLPHASDNAFELMQNKLAFDAPRMSTLTGIEFPESVERVLAKALEREPARRHGSAGAFIAELAAAVQAHATATLPRLSVPRLSAVSHAAAQRPAPVTELERTHSLEMGLHETAMALHTPPDAAPVVLPRKRWLAYGVIGAVAVGAVVAVIALWPEPAPLPVVRPQPAVLQPKAAPALAAAAAEAPTVATPAASLPEPPEAPEAPEVERPARAAAPRPRKAAAAPAAPAPAEAPDPITANASELVYDAQTELVQGHPAAAAKLYEQATKLDPRNAAAFRGLGLVSESLGHRTDAIRALRRALQLAPRDPKNALLEERLRKLEQQPSQ